MPLLLFVVWLAAEIFVIVKVAESIGVLLTILLLVAAWPLGSWAMRSEGRAVLRRANAALAEGRAPGREMVDGTLVLLGGALLMVPGFISDALGLILLVPPTRSLVRAGLARNLQHRLVARAGRFAGGRGGPGGPGGHGGPGGRGGPFGPFGGSGGPGPVDVEGTAVEIDPPQLRP